MSTSEKTVKDQILENKDNIVDLFHALYYTQEQETWKNSHFLGYPILKCPLDMWVYQEMIVELKPDVIIETGTFCGASAAFMALICDVVRNGKVITVDIDHSRPHPEHPRITYVTGSSTAPDIVTQVRSLIPEGAKVMAILDSDHSRDHVFNELNVYAPLITPGQYLIVEDTNVNGHPVRPEFGPGPMEALDEYLATSRDFEIDRSKEKFMMTQNPRGYLKCVRSDTGCV